MNTNNHPGTTDRKKILLLLLPFWTPLIPPMGISCLKGFLQKHGYNVKTIDANIEAGFREINDNYFKKLESAVPGDHRGNLLNIGIDVLQGHMTAHLHRERDNEARYIELVKSLIYKTFYSVAKDSLVRELNAILDTFFLQLETYMLDILEKEQPHVLGLSTFKGILASSLFAFKLAKEKYPLLLTVMGGGIFADQLAMGSPNFDYFIENTPYIDKIIIGEGELLLLKLLQGEVPAHEKVLTSQDMNCGVMDLSTADLPDFSDLQMKYYPNMASYTSRSCPFQCNFCSETINWGTYRKKKAKQVVRELTQLYEQGQCQLFLLSDSLLNPIISELAREFLTSDIALYWDGYLRVDRKVCNPENTFMWRRGGFYRARLGIESGSSKVLEAMNKEITPQQIKTAVSNLAQAGIKTTTYWVIGFPGETEEDFLQTLDLIESLKNDIYEVDCNPFRFHLSGQVKSLQWREKKIARLYPKWAREFLLMETWFIDNANPSREDIYRRVNRFLEHCKKLGIPNPYSLDEICKADERWQKLHKNAVPPLLDLQQGSAYINECKHLKKLQTAVDMFQKEEDDDFDFI